ncbi:glycoside hydrolase family protein [Parabacteroides goldsteinii]|jgi:hypothetical protein|uniref:glycoside hydrolase family protein n=1 Tax=Parabacteroides goldsteinii TaxID=328812 RepID=UPI0022E73EE5|nr:glycoside hydrolase family protein [Parabacteroides goldsteinii]
MNYEKHKLVHLCVALLFFATFAEAKQILIVSPKGNDKGRGSLYSPFATVERALSEAARYAGDSVEIRIREGMYPLGRTIDVKGYSNLLIAPYQGEKVSFTGSIKLQPKHLRPVSEPEVSGRLQPEVRKQVREINLQELGYTLTGLTPKGFGRPALPSWSELFINGQPQHIARWPNDSTVLIGKVHCTGDIPREQKYGLGDPVFEYAEQRLNTVHYDQPPYVTAYPLLAGYWENNPRIPRGNLISSNLFFQVKRILNGQPAWAEWSNNYITNLNPGFKDPDDPIKGFLPDAAVYKYIYDFSPLPFEEMGCSLPEDWSQRSYQAGPVDMEVVQRGDSEFPVGFSAFSLEDHFVWCGSAIRAEEDGRYYLFYSAMESGTGHPPFVDAWLLGSKIGVAVSDSPYGGYKNIGFVYNKDGYTPDRSSWDAQTVSNTHIKRFNGKYYLYYCGSVDPGENARIKGTLSKRDRIQQNQKLGVLCFNSIKDLLEGKYTCNEQPLLIPRSRVKPNNVLEPSPEGTAVKPDNLIMVNPAVVYCPANRKYFLYFKGNVYDPGWRGVHGVAISDEPAGPFRVLDDNVFEFETGTDQKLNAEDPYVWYHRKDRCFYAVFKDFTGGFTQGKPGLAIMYSKDGLHWELPEHSLFMNKEIILKNGEHVDVDRLERPQLFLDENDDPIVLYSACSITPLNQKKDGSSFNIQIPVLCSSGNPVTRFPR